MDDKPSDKELLDEAYRVALNALGAWRALRDLTQLYPEDVPVGLGNAFPGLEGCLRRCENFVDAYQGAQKNSLRFAHTYTPHNPQEELE